MLALSIFTGSHPPTIVDESELNFCVRDGNRWTLRPISTNFVDANFVSFASVQAQKLIHAAASPLKISTASLG